MSKDKIEIIDRVKSGDIEAFRRLDRELFADNIWSHSAWLSELNSAKIYMLKKGSECIGLLSMVVAGDDLEIRKIGIQTPYQRTGLGSLLLKTAFDFATQEPEIARIILDVSKTNEKAIRFYEKAGFEKLGHRRRYYTDGSDAYLYVFYISSAAELPSLSK